LPGQTINIVVPLQSQFDASADSTSPFRDTEDHLDSEDRSENVFDSLVGLTNRAVNRARDLDDKYKLSQKLQQIAQPAVDKLRLVDEKYQIVQTTSTKIHELDEAYAISARTTALVNAGVQRIREVDESHRLTQRATETGDRLYAFAREIDARFAVSATAARVVELTRNLLVAGFNKAVELDEKHNIADRAAALLAAGATVVANQVEKYTKPQSEVAEAVSGEAVATN